MQQSLRLGFFSVDSLPFRDRNFLRPVGASSPGKAILEHSGRVREQILVLGAFRANIEAHLRLMMCPVHKRPNARGIAP